MKLTAIGSGYYVVFKDGVKVSSHTTEREAIEKAVALELANPESHVTYKHEYEVKVESAVLPNPDPTPIPTPDPDPTPIPPLPAGRLFAESSFWYADAQALPIHPQSAALVAELYANVKIAGGKINDVEWSNGIYFATASDPILPVFQTKEPLGAVAIELAKGIRIPAGFKSAMNRDGHGCIVDPIAGKEYDFWRLKEVNGRWECTNAGIIPLGGDGINKRMSVWNSATASHLPLSLRPISRAEWLIGDVGHCIGLAINRPKKHPAVVWPAQTTDGWYEGSNAIPQGTRFRFPANVAIDSAWPYALKLLVVTIRDNGCVVLDKTGGGASFYVQDPTQFGEDGTWLKSYLGGIPQYKLFGDPNNAGMFPWRVMEAVA